MHYGKQSPKQVSRCACRLGTFFAQRLLHIHLRPSKPPISHLPAAEGLCSPIPHHSENEQLLTMVMFKNSGHDVCKN
eukprot:TRINITY_DN4422_c0_g1_i1.p1 TRINITY_DN4422_c0_g1~~TRINITY_DN4422_c0_g1_i1.p1  ORF type:complete len:77 (-),score=4.54 TRINITY_DN4422_c0_g1_i1:43-273(-)